MGGESWEQLSIFANTTLPEPMTKSQHDLYGFSLQITKKSRIKDLSFLDAVAFGSDYGGSGRLAPTGLETSEGLPLLVYRMLKRGYSENEISRVMGGNFVSLMERVEQAKSSAPMDTRH